MRTFSTKRPRGGFTLLESVASIALLGIALGYLVVGHREVCLAAARCTNREHAAQATAAWLAERAIESDWDMVAPEGVLDEETGVRCSFRR